MTPDQLNALAQKPSAITPQLPHSPAAGVPQPTVNIDQQLQALADIHLPEAVSWWPPAPGWWIAGILVLILIYLSYRYLSLYLRNRKLRKLILTELDNIKRHWQKQHNLFITSGKLSTLLRRIALYIEPRKKVASLQGAQWINYLQQQKGLQQCHQYQSLLLDYAYQDPLIQVDMKEQKQQSQLIEQLFDDIKQWITKGVHHV